MKIAEKIKTLRKEREIKQIELAKAMNLSVQTISGYETGYAQPPLDVAVKLADYFQITTDELLGRENYATGVVEVMGEQLTEKEKQLLQRFRSLDQDGQTAFLDIADNIAKLYKTTKSAS